MRFTPAVAVAGLLMFTACYHATVETGRTPSTQQFERRWAASWIGGLVPPSAVNTAQACPSGVARVDTQLSFPNMLVGALTLGIYTPMEIVVTCAQTGAAADLPVVADAVSPKAAMEIAVRTSAQHGTAVLVRF